MTANLNWIRFLRKIWIFSTFSEDQLAHLASKLKQISIPKGAQLIKAGDPGSALYIISSGSMRAIPQINNKHVPSGLELNPIHLDRGSAMGELALLAGEPFSFTATAESTVELLVLEKSDFDQVIQKNPVMGVHLSRILSSRLAFMNKNIPLERPSKFFSILTAIPSVDQVILAANLGIALAEQTRKRVLLFFVGGGYESLAKCLDFSPADLKKYSRAENPLLDPARFDTLSFVHASGLEIVCVDEKSFTEKAKDFPSLFAQTIKDKFDFCLLILPPSLNETIVSILGETDRCLVITGAQSNPLHLQVCAQLAQRISPKNMEKIWLSTSSHPFPSHFFPDIKLPWDIEWGQRFMKTGTPWLPPDAHTGHKMMARLARNLGGLLVGFAMGSGAAFGYALIGMLRVMEREGIYPDVIAGTSMGALIGALYAAEMPIDQIEKIAEQMSKRQVWKLLDFAFSGSGLFRGSNILNFLRSHLGDKTFADLSLPFACVATDIETGKEIDITDGNVAEAVRASISLPFFFQPHYMNGRYLVDGGLVNPVPTSVIINLGANILISANLTAPTVERRLPKLGWLKKLSSILRAPSFSEIILKTMYTMQYEIAVSQAEIAHVVLQPHATNYLWWDLDKAGQVIKLGEICTEESLRKIKSYLPFFSNSCQFPLHNPGPKIDRRQ